MLVSATLEAAGFFLVAIGSRMDCTHCGCVDCPYPCLGAVMSCVRLYLEPSDKLPPSMRPASFVPIIDCAPEQARDLKRRLIRQGYSVTAVPL